MKDIDQKIIKFNYDDNFKEDDFYVSKSNKQIFDLLNKWPKWEKNFLNISGEKFSGKTHLINIFLKQYKGTQLEANLYSDNDFQKIKNFQNIILENVSEKINENLFFTLCNIVEQDNKYLIVTSESSIVSIDFKLNDLKSRSKNFLLQNIDKPDDELLFALILKNLSDRQISIDKKLIDYIIKRIDRSYGKIVDFIYKIDEVSLKKKRSINLSTIKEVLGE